MMPETMPAPPWQWGWLWACSTNGWPGIRGKEGLMGPPHAVQTLITQTLSRANPTAITAEEYFNPNFELGNRDMGRPMELTTKTQK